MIRSTISRETCLNHHVTNVQHGSACSCTTLHYCTTWMVVVHVQQHIITIGDCFVFGCNNRTIPKLCL